MDEKLLWKLDIRNSRQHNTKQNKKKIQTVGFKFIDVKDFVYLFFKKDLASSIS